MGPTVLDERGAFAVENPEVAEVMEIASGDHLDHGEVIGTDFEKAIQLRMALRTDIKRGTPHYACSLCGVPVYLVSRAEERRFILDLVRREVLQIQGFDDFCFQFRRRDGHGFTS